MTDTEPSFACDRKSLITTNDPEADSLKMRHHSPTFANYAKIGRYIGTRIDYQR